MEDAARQSGLAVLRELAPPVCVECDYPLIGLPDGTRCPECGAASDPSVLTLHGWGKGSHSSLVTMRPRDAMITMMVVGAFCAWWTFEYFQGRGQRLPTAFVLIYAGWIIVLLVRRWMVVPGGSAAAGPVRLRVGPAGFEQRLGPGPLKLTPWHRDMVVAVQIHRHRKQTLAAHWRAFSFHVSLASELIGFEFDADPEQAHAMLALIQQWIRDA